MVVSIHDIEFRNPDGLLAGSASQIAWRMRGIAPPTCIDSGEIYLYIVSFPLGVTISGCADILRMIHGWRCAWCTAATQESLSLFPNILTTSTTGKRRMLKPYCTLLCIYPRMNPTISWVHADAWGPFLMDFPGPPSTRAVLY